MTGINCVMQILYMVSPVQVEHRGSESAYASGIYESDPHFPYDTKVLLMMMLFSKAATGSVASNLSPSSPFLTPQALFVSLRPPDDHRVLKLLILGSRLSNCLIVLQVPLTTGPNNIV